MFKNQKKHLSKPKSDNASQLIPLLSRGAYLPITQASLDYHDLSSILNEIVVNSRECIVEFGSGISTLLIGRLFKTNQLLGRTLISFEHDEGWYRIIQEMLKTERLDDQVQIVYAPLNGDVSEYSKVQWYDQGIFNETLVQLSRKVDMVLIDGPPAWMAGYELSRYPAFPSIRPFLSDGYIILLDDTHRAGEKKILAEWLSLESLKMQRFSESMSGLYKGQFYSALPQ